MPGKKPTQIGNYRVIREIGRGGMGVVYEADHQRVKNRVAIKVLHAQYVAEPQVREDLKREAGVLARLNHPNILRVIDFGVTEELVIQCCKRSTFCSKLSILIGTAVNLGVAVCVGIRCYGIENSI